MKGCERVWVIEHRSIYHWISRDSIPTDVKITGEIGEAKIFRSLALAQKENPNPKAYEVRPHFIPIYREHAGSPLIGKTFPK